MRELILMAKMSKAVAKRRLEEARKKVNFVYLEGHISMNQLKAIVEPLGKAIIKLK